MLSFFKNFALFLWWSKKMKWVQCQHHTFFFFQWKRITCVLDANEKLYTWAMSWTPKLFFLIFMFFLWVYKLLLLFVKHSLIVLFIQLSTEGIYFCWNCFCFSSRLFLSVFFFLIFEREVKDKFYLLPTSKLCVCVYVCFSSRTKQRDNKEKLF